MNFIFCKLEKPQKTWISFFASLNNLKKMNFIFYKLKKLQKTWRKGRMNVRTENGLSRLWSENERDFLIVQQKVFSTTQEMLLLLWNIVCWVCGECNKSQIFPSDTTKFDLLNETTRKWFNEQWKVDSFHGKNVESFNGSSFGGIIQRLNEPAILVSLNDSTSFTSIVEKKLRKMIQRKNFRGMIQRKMTCWLIQRLSELCFIQLLNHSTPKHIVSFCYGKSPHEMNENRRKCRRLAFAWFHIQDKPGIGWVLTHLHTACIPKSLRNEYNQGSRRIQGTDAIATF